MWGICLERLDFGVSAFCLDISSNTLYKIFGDAKKTFGGEICVLQNRTEEHLLNEPQKIEGMAKNKEKMKWVLRQKQMSCVF